MTGNLIYTAQNDERAEHIATIINFIYDENYKKGNDLESAMIESYKLDEVLEPVREIIRAYGWFISETGKNEKTMYAVVRRLGPFSVIPPMVRVGSCVYLDESRIIVNRPQHQDNIPTKVQSEKQTGGSAACAKSPVRQASPKSPTDKQVGGSHYQLPIQPIEYILANGLGYCEANVVKYVSRWRNKGGIQDLKKAIHYLEMLIEQEEKDASKKS